MQKKKHLVPKMRFPEFEEEWKNNELQKEVTLNPKNTELPFSFIYIDLESVTNGNLIKEERIKRDDAPSRAQRLLSKGDILYQTVRPYQKNNYFFNKNETDYVASTGYAQIRTKNDSNYIYQYLHTDYFVNKVLLRCTGTSYPAINSTDLSKIRINLPQLKEQQKIAQFLTAIDTRIQILEKKKSLLEQYKKGVMQKIFKQEIRFKDDNGKEFPAWEKKRLGEYLNHKSNRNKNLKIDRVLSVSNSKGFILQSEQFDNHRVASKDVSNYKIVEKGDVAYNPSRINVGSIAILKDFDNGIISPMYVVFSLKNTLNINFFENIIKTHLFNHLVKVGCSGSVRDSLNFDDLESFRIKIPSLKEQTKIAHFLSAIDQKIALTNQQIEHTKTYKKGLLQQMFV